MRNRRVADKAKAVAHMNEQGGIHIKHTIAIFLFRFLPDNEKMTS